MCQKAWKRPGQWKVSPHHYARVLAGDTYIPPGLVCTLDL